MTHLASHGPSARPPRLRIDRDVLAEIIAHLPFGVLIARSPSGRLISANASAERILRRTLLPPGSLDECLGSARLRADGRPCSPEEWPPARSVRTGEVVASEEVVLRLGDGTLGAVGVGSAPIRDPEGHPVAVVVTLYDAHAGGGGDGGPHVAALIAQRAAAAIRTARLIAAERAARQAAERAAERVTRLHAVATALAGVLTPGEIVDTAMRQAVAAVEASAGVAVLLDAGGTTVSIAGMVNYPPALAHHWRHFPVSTPMPLAEAVHTGRPIWLGSRDEAHARYPRLLSPRGDDGFSAWAVVPLVVHERPVGALQFCFDAPRRFREPEREFVVALAAECAQALERARLHEAEITARRAAEGAAARLARLQAVTAALSEAVTPAQVARVVLEQGQVALAARAGVVVCPRDAGAEVEVVHATGIPDDAAAPWRSCVASLQTPAADAMRGAAPVVVQSRDALALRYPHLVEAADRLGVAAAVAVPLAAKHRVIGALTFFFATARAFAEDDWGFLRALAQQCAQAIERARLYEHEHRVAEALQRAFLPAGLPEIPGIGIDAHYIPGAAEADIGGDWYDVFELPDGRIALSVGDVVGRGLQAAAVMGQARQAIRTVAWEDHTPASVLHRAGRVLTLAYRGETMATAIFGVLDPVSRAITYACAGHPAPLLGTPDGRVETLPAGGVPLGIEHGGAPPAWTVPLARGSMLVLYTDGLVLSTRDVAKGETALVAAIRAELEDRSPDPAARIAASMLGHRRQLRDDVALLVVSVAQAPLEELAMTVPANPLSLALVRRSFRRLARDLGLPPDRTFALQVALGEALNNAIEHAYGPGAGTIEIRAWRERASLVIEVEDHGRWRPERVEGRGYGLVIMRALADAVDIAHRLSRTVVRLSAALPEPPGAPEASVPLRSASGPGAVPASPPVPAAPPAACGQFDVRVLDGVPVVDVRGDIDLANAAEMARTLDRAAQTDHRAIVVALGAAGYFDSQAIHVLFRFGRRLVVDQRRLLLVTPAGSALSRILTITGACERFPVFGALDEALRSAAQHV